MKVTLPEFERAGVMVVGDVMLDRYWYGPTSRISQNDIMEEQEAMALTRAYTTLRDELHHLALQELPGHVSEDCFTAERELVRASWQKWLVEE